MLGTLFQEVGTSVSVLLYPAYMQPTYRRDVFVTSPLRNEHPSTGAVGLQRLLRVFRHHGRYKLPHRPRLPATELRQGGG